MDAALTARRISSPQGRWGIDSPSTTMGWRVLWHRC